jgi:quercetin dioxygenase-like cupin family protein
MCGQHFLCFVTSAEAQVEVMPWGRHEWFSRAGLTGAEQLQVVRVTMPPGKAHAFHRHPGFEEVLYVLSGA